MSDCNWTPRGTMVVNGVQRDETNQWATLTVSNTGGDPAEIVELVERAVSENWPFVVPDSWGRAYDRIEAEPPQQTPDPAIGPPPRRAVAVGEGL